MCGKNCFIFARMGLGRQQHGPVADLPAQFRQGFFIAGQRRGVGLQAAHHLDVPRTQRAEARRAILVLGQHHVEG